MDRLAEFIEQLKNSSFVKDTSILTLGTVLAQVISMASMLVMSRLYSPADFGSLAVFMAVSNIVATAVTLRYETSILLPKDENESVKLVQLALTLLVVFGFLFAGCSLLLPEKIKVVIGVSILGGWITMAVLTSMGIALIAVGTAWLNRNCAYSKMAQLRIVQSTVAAVTGVTLGAYGFSSGLMVAQIASLAITSALVLILLFHLPTFWNKRLLYDVAWKHRFVPKFLLPTALIDMVTQQLPVLLITAWFSSESAGQFNMAWSILALPISLVGGAVGQVFIQRFAQVWPDVSSARRLLYKTWKLLAIVGIVPTLLVMLFGQQLFCLVLGSAWAESGQMAEIMAPMLLAMLISSPTSGTYLVLGMQRCSLFFGILVLVYRPLCIYFGLLFGQLKSGLLVLVIAEIAQIFLYQYLVVKRFRRTA